MCGKGIHSKMVIVDNTVEERYKGQENSTEEGWIEQHGERRNSDSTAVNNDIRRRSTAFVGDSIVGKPDSRLNKREGGVICLLGARIEHATERKEQVMGAGKGYPILVNIGTNNAEIECTTDI